MTSAAEPVTYNPLDPIFRTDPYPMYRRLREEAPVHQGMLGAWVLSRYADCVRLLRDPRVSNDVRNSTLFQQMGTDPAYELGAERPFLFADPPDHTRLRGLVSKAFTPKVVEGLRPRIREIVGDLLDAARERGRLEVIEDLAYPLPIQVICELLGVPVEDHATFKEWSRALARGLDPDFVLPPEEAEARTEAILNLQDYIGSLIPERRAHPRDDLLSALIAAEDDGRRLTEGELRSTCTLLLVAGHETTVNLIGNGVLALVRHADQLAALARDPSLAKGTVEEVLRYDPPVQMTIRVLLDDFTIDGCTLERGGQAVLLLAAANRDPAEFAEPDRFDITRGAAHHLAFGNGIHFCLGAPLARVEGQEALAAFAARVHDPVLAVDPPPYRENIVLRGLAALDVTFSDIAPRSGVSG